VTAFRCTDSRLIVSQFGFARDIDHDLAMCRQRFEFHLKPVDSQVPWSIKALSGYLGEKRRAGASTMPLGSSRMEPAS
jgi:hypothetical protein